MRVTRELDIIRLARISLSPMGFPGIGGFKTWLKSVEFIRPFPNVGLHIRNIASRVTHSRDSKGSIGSIFATDDADSEYIIDNWVTCRVIVKLVRKRRQKLFERG